MPLRSVIFKKQFCSLDLVLFNILLYFKSSVRKTCKDGEQLESKENANAISQIQNEFGE